MFLSVVYLGLAVLIEGSFGEVIEEYSKEEGGILLKHILHKRDTSSRYGPLPYTHGDAPLPVTSNTAESSDQEDTSARGTYYRSPETVQSQFNARVGVVPQADIADSQDYERQRREREREEYERRRRERIAEVERRNQEIAEANRRNQAIIESRRQASRTNPSAEDQGSSSSSSTGDSSSSSSSSARRQYTSTSQGQYPRTGQRQRYTVSSTGSSTGQGQGQRTYYTPTVQGSETGQSYPVYGYNGQQGSVRPGQGVYSRGYQPRGGYVPSSGSYVPSSGSYVPSSGSYVPGSSSYVSSSGRYVPSSGSYVPSSGSLVPSSGSFVPSSGRYVPSSGSYVPSSGSYVPGSGSYVPSGGPYVPQSNVPAYTANPIYDSVCPSTGVRLRINGLECTEAINQYGSSICYRHEFTSRECCDRCQPLKKPGKLGCEYGDHSYQCRQMQRFDCYDLRQSQRCCESCERFRTGEPGCEYGDMTPRCQQIRDNPSLCYVPDNARFCCSTCKTIKDNNNPECPWGDHNSNLCHRYGPSGDVMVNCYSEPIKRLCCQTCERIKSRYSGQYAAPGCEYGDRPVVFNTVRFGSLNCTSFIRQFSMEQCQSNPAVAENCCFTCRRYQQG